MSIPPPSQHQPQLPPQITAKLAELRRRIRLYVWAEGLASVVVVLAVAFWIGLAGDWLLEPSPQVRRIAWICVAAAALVTSYRLILRRVFAPLPQRSLALLVEKTHEPLDESLVTAVELMDRPKAGIHVHSGMLRQTAEHAAGGLASVQLGRVFRRGPLARAVGMAAVLCLSIASFAVLEREAFGVWLARMQLSPDPWPRRVQLLVEGFAENAQGQREEKIPPDARFELVVRADLGDEHVAPDVVEIRYQQEDGRRGRDTMTKVGDAEDSSSGTQLYRYTFQDVTSNLSFEVVGGDDRVRDLHLRVVPRPRLVDIRLACRYPTYMNRSAEVLDVTGSMLIPRGTQVRVLAKSTKPLLEMKLEEADLRMEPQQILPQGPNATQLDFALPALEEDLTLLLTLLDADGISGKRPTRLSLLAAADEAPAVAVRPEGIGTSITPEARIPFQGSVDDPRYGLESVWFECLTGEGNALRIPLAESLGGSPQLRIDHALDLRETDPATSARRLLLAPGDRLNIAVKASDFFDLGNENHDGSSQTFVLEVVTAERLRALLERRELTLRQRFESIYERMVDTRNLLGRVEFAEDAGAADQAAAGGGVASPAERTFERRRLRVAGAVQNIEQAAHESLGVAEGFEDIQLQLTNNRVETPELLARLGDRIALPLRQIAAEQLPALRNQLERVQLDIEDAQAARPQLEQALSQADAVLVAMEQVLQQMLELESYNEVLDLLRNIIEQQRRLNEETQEQQKERLRGLLD